MRKQDSVLTALEPVQICSTLSGLQPFRSQVSQDVNVTWETRAVRAALQNINVPVQVLWDSSGFESAVDLFWYQTFTARRGSQSKESYCHIQEAYITCLSWGSSSSCVREVYICGFTARNACSYPVSHSLAESVVRRFWYPKDQRGRGGQNLKK